MSLKKYLTISEKYKKTFVFNSINRKQFSPALFLDRDGVIIEDRHNIVDPDKVCLCKGSYDFIREVYSRKIKIVVVTNQSGISKGIFNWSKYEEITEKMLSLLGEPIPITAIYANGFSKDSLNKDWRKPSPKMINEAAKTLNIDKKCSVMIGDRLTDLQSGVRAGISSIVHLMTGHGVNERKNIIELLDSNMNLKDGINSSKIMLYDNLENIPIGVINNLFNNKK
tara:strand:- start:10719 stop:11393 length:675 start_codon:yes stop_codon:yes gene_type:complete